MKNYIKISIYILLAAGLMSFRTDYKTSAIDAFPQDTNRNGISPSINSADSSLNQGRNTDGVVPEVNNTFNQVPDSVRNPDVNEVPVGKPPVSEDSLQQIKNKELPVIKNDTTIINVEPEKNK